ncbi:MAG: 2-oxoacid:acceptor oxidoreductase subunit alpha [Candidatus Saganbacteria bacterium]|nr:2-oxoacid:acceptor oxidoreductase subunit alpha [Candidatus Saganbacteria bacterium]
MEIRDDISIVLCGEAGQGIQTIEQILAPILKNSGYNIFASKEYMSRVRGGSNSTLLRVSSQRVAAWVDTIDLLIPLDKAAITHLADRISHETIIIGEKVKLHTKKHVIDVPFAQVAEKAGNPLYSNVVAVGVIAGLLKIELSVIQQEVKSYFSKKSEEVIAGNIDAAKKGYKTRLELAASGKLTINIKKNYQVKHNLLLNGTEAVALGALAGGCNFVSSYPMTPGTGVLTMLAKYSKEFNVIVEQAEDEIAAINMALGAWYAGGRALVTTSGGGFALMVEGLSLAGMIETPLVIHLAQRPGPATGLPTRTEQADLEFALYSGHGEFPRIIFAPGNVQDAFLVTHRAFRLADKYQVPVFILTDQYFVDSYYNISSLDFGKVKDKKHIIKTQAGYKRFKITKSGISPRGIPGYGEGVVCVDSDEHDEEGYITENLKLRTKMVEKRLRKLAAIKQRVMEPELIGEENYKTLVVGWGSTYHVIKEALEQLDCKEIAFLYFKQVYPLHPMAGEYLKNAEKTVIVENNATSQFGKLIKLETGIEIGKKILQYNGLPFSVEKIVSELRECNAE